MKEQIQDGLNCDFSDIQESFKEKHEQMKENIRENIKENIPANVQENIEQFKVKRTSRQYARMMAGGMCSLIGTLLAIYVAGWLMLFVPVKEAFTAFMVGALTKKMVITTAIKCALSLTTGGAIWCGGYILSRKCIGYEET